ncbi:competence protein ComK [Halolactibacillus alkaliphilus]|uniref:competence protein ComK n=1 Tax=Halolactibacillus alkaliphilus TaxID=442899 RepID=UPI001E3BD222|nr:competence protein ComK [Halolactibacillus alkaliphilus]
MTHNTLYLEQSFSPDAETIIEEHLESYTCSDTMKNILENSCMSFGSTVDGRKKSMKNLFNLSHIPVFPISPHHDLYCFQTHSPRTDHCLFIMTTHLTHFVPDDTGITFYFSSGKTKHVLMTKARIERIMALLYSYHLYFRNALPTAHRLNG